MKQILFLLMAMCLMAGCKTSAPPVQTKTVETVITKTVIETVRDTVVHIAPDVATLKALIECDSAGRATVKQLQAYQAGTHVKPPVIKIDEDNVLTATAVVDSFSIYMAFKERVEAISMEEKEQEIQLIYTNIIDGWQWFQIWTGRLAILVLILYAGFKGLKFYTRKFLQ